MQNASAWTRNVPDASFVLFKSMHPDPLDLPWLSATARAWLEARGVRRARQPHDEIALRGEWEGVITIERRYGGLEGVDPIDGRRIWIGVSPGALARRSIGECEYAVVGGYDPILWLADANGRVVELDDLGERFYESDTMTHRFEQLALFDHGPSVARLDGGHGDRLNHALGLRPLAHASDSRQRYWARDIDDLLVRESLEPSDYGRRDLVTITWVTGPSDEIVAAALAAVES